MTRAGKASGRPGRSRVHLLAHVCDVAFAALDGDDERCFRHYERRLRSRSRGDAFEGLAHFRGDRRRANDFGMQVALFEDAPFDRRRDPGGIQVFRGSGACRVRGGGAAGADQRCAGKGGDGADASATSSEEAGDSWSGRFSVHARILMVLRANAFSLRPHGTAAMKIRPRPHGRLARTRSLTGMPRTARARYLPCRSFGARQQVRESASRGAPGGASVGYRRVDRTRSV
jgi:hypothetical protein